MKILSPIQRFPTALVLLMISLFVFLGGCADIAPHSITLDNGQQAIIAKGVVKKVNLHNNTILFRQLQSDEITITLSDSVSYKVITSYSEISEGMSLEIAYQSQDGLNKAVTIKKLPDLGCGKE